MQGSVAPNGGGTDCERSGQVNLACTDCSARFGVDRARLSGQQRPVEFGMPVGDFAIHRHPPTRAHPDQITDPQVRKRNLFFNTIDQPRCARHFERRQLFRRGSRGGAGAVIQITPCQKEERERQCGIEIRVFPGQRGFPK